MQVAVLIFGPYATRPALAEGPHAGLQQEEEPGRGQDEAQTSPYDSVRSDLQALASPQHQGAPDPLVVVAAVVGNCCEQNFNQPPPFQSEVENGIDTSLHTLSQNCDNLPVRSAPGCTPDIGSLQSATTFRRRPSRRWPSNYFCKAVRGSNQIIL